MQRAADELDEERLQREPVEMIREAIPTLAGAGPECELPGEGDWENVDVAARVSAAGMAFAVADVRPGQPAAASSAPDAAMVNPDGYNWQSILSEGAVQRWKSSFEAAQKRGTVGEDDGDGLCENGTECRARRCWVCYHTCAWLGR